MSEIESAKLKLFPPPLDVDLDEGFSPELDLFGRAPIAAGLTRLIERVDQPLVLAVDGSWGSGKTTFLRFWTGELRKLGYPVIFFDAFENDYVDDPFLALAGEVFALAQSESESGQVAKGFAAKAAGAGRVLLRSSLKIGVKAATMGALNAADLDDFAEAISDEAAEVLDSSVGEMITRRRESQKSVQDFRSALSSLPGKLATGADAGDSKPLVFIVDELDRCRPGFALSLLERVKHFFSVPNVHFVLGLNSDQLMCSVKAVYGSGIDARLYLQKFIHLHWTLTKRERYSSDRSRATYVEYLSRALGFTGKDAETAGYATKFVGAVAEAKELSFRTIERVMSVISLAVATTPSSVLRVSPLIGGLALMKVIEPKLFEKAKRGRLSFAEVADFMSFSDLHTDQADSWEWAESWWRFVTDPDAPQELIERMQRGLFSYHFGDRMDILSFTADSVMDNVTFADR